MSALTMPYYWETDNAYNPGDGSLRYAEWLAYFRGVWHQGEHVSLIGQTGSGKTFVGSDILNIRDYVAVLAIKPQDDTLLRFTRRAPKYTRSTKWPVPYNVNRALLHFKPKNLADPMQAQRVSEVLDGIYHSGGWCVFLDDLAYIINTLGQRRKVVDLMNVGRSHGISVVSALQQPTSISAGVPSEMKKQVKHLLIWKYTGLSEIEACADLMGMTKTDLRELMARLSVYDNGTDRYSDFIHYRRGYDPVIVRVS